MVSGSRSRGFTVLSLFLIASCGGGGGDGGIGLAAFIGGPAAQADGSFDYNLTVVFSNDIHDQIRSLDSGRGGLARHATVVRLLREQAATRGVELFLANAGDNFEGSLFYEADGGALLFRLLDQIGYDVVQIGNHDHQFGVQALFDVFSQAFPGLTQDLRVLWGNVNPSEMSALGTDPNAVMATFTPAQVEPAAIDAFENAFVDFESGQIDPTLMDAPLSNSKLFNQTLFYDLGGIRIGVFGLDIDEVLYSSVPGEGDLFVNADGRAENLRFYPPATHGFASAMIDYLGDPDQDPATDDGADIIMAVTHIGLDADIAVAQNAVGSNGRRIDLIVGGHSHTRLNTNVTVDHGGGLATQIVQAGERGEFIGRIDLLVDPATNSVTCKNAELIDVNERFPADPDLAQSIDSAAAAPGGIDELFGGAFSTPIADNQQLLPGALPSISSLGSLAADACLTVGNAAPLSLDLDIIVIGNFVFRSDLSPGPVTISDVQQTLPLHILNRDGRDADRIDFIDLPGGLRQALDPSGFPIPGPNLQNITALEYFLELIFSAGDIIQLIGGLFGFDIGAIDDFIAGLQWSGIEFVFDESGPILDRIDPATIVVGGIPLIGNESSSWRLGLNAVVARIALPFFQLLSALEEPAGSGLLIPFPTYDPAVNATDLVIWEALRDQVAELAVLDPVLVRVTGDRPRTLAPDLSFNPIDVTGIPPAPGGGDPVTLSIPVLNLGHTAVNSGTVVLEIDLTPNCLADNPDGITDARTGLTPTILSATPFGTVPAYAAGAAGQLTIQASFVVPTGLAAGEYPVSIRLENITSSDPAFPESILSNNGGPRFAVTLSVP